MKKLLILACFIFTIKTGFAQCNIAAFALDTTLCFGTSTSLTALSTISSAGALPLNYCACKALGANGADITKVKFGALANSTNCLSPLLGSQGIATGTPNLFSDFTASAVPVPVLTAGSNVAFEMEVKSCTNVISNTVFIYIDYNRDGDFADTMELAFTQLNVNTPSTIIGQFTLPPVVVNGNTLARIVVQDGAPIIANGCGNYLEGETEDYVVNLLNDTVTYSWAPSATLNVSTGAAVIATPTVNTIYTVTATNSVGCVSTASILVQVANSPLNFNTSNIVNITCFGLNNGSATANVSGGTSPFNYLWLPSNSTSSMPTNLAVGTNTISVTDAFGCTTLDSVIITQPTALNANTAGSNSLCFEPATASITNTTTGGSLPYTYNWTPNVSTTNQAQNLAAGVYTLVVTDAKACTKSTIVTVSAPQPIISTVALQPNNAIAFVNGGIPPYNYNWQPGNFTTQAITSTAGPYTLTITDANGCTGTKIITIPAPTALQSWSTPAITVSAVNHTIIIDAVAIDRVQVLDAFGRVVYNNIKKINGLEQVTLPLASGIYLVQLSNIKGETLLKKIVLQ
jgi:hypothetical protein